MRARSPPCAARSSGCAGSPPAIPRSPSILGCPCYAVPGTSPHMSARERRLLLVAFFTAVLGAWPCLGAAQPQELPAQIVTLGGRAELSRRAGPWAAAALRDELSAGDAVRTIAGRLAVLTGSAQSLRLGAHTQIVFAADAPPATPGPTQVRMNGGLLWVSVMPNSPPSTHIEVRAGPATVT